MEYEKNIKSEEKNYLTYQYLVEMTSNIFFFIFNIFYIFHNHIWSSIKKFRIKKKKIPQPYFQEKKIISTTISQAKKIPWI